MANEQKTRAVKKDPKKDTKSLRLGKSRHPFVTRLERVFPANLLILLGTCALVTLLYPYVSTVQTFDVFKEGEVASETIIAPFTFDIPKSPDELERERQEAMDKILLVVDFDSGAQGLVTSRLRKLQTSFLKIIDEETSDSAKNIARDEVEKNLSENTVEVLLERIYLFDDAMLEAERAMKTGILSELLVESPGKLSELRARYNMAFESYRIYSKAYVTLRKDTVSATVPVAELLVKEVVLESISNRLRTNRRLESQSLNAIYELLETCLRPNAIVNDEETRLLMDRAASSVLTIKGKVIKDTEIVRKHQEVTPAIAERLRALQVAIVSMAAADQRRRVVAGNLGRLGLCLLPLLFLGYYVKRYHPRIVANPKHSMALMFVVVLQIALIRLGLEFVPLLGATELSQTVPEYLIPVTLGTMLATILFSVEVGFVVSLYVSLFFGVVTGVNLGMFVFALLGGFVAGYATKNIRYRWDFFRAIPSMVAIYAVFVALWQLSGGRDYSVSTLLLNMGLTTINAIAATILSFMSPIVFENLFDITTNMTLVELSDMNNPVLKRLSIEAPGTYNHSVLVANLAESAAERIGANALLARVASYYHDIGKLEKSDYFIENVTGVERNKHNKLAPSMSALIISSHVKEGIELARRHKLPKVIRDSILQHHGTSLVSFFFEKAVEQDPHKQVQEKDFRYPGPRPQSKEIAVIMLADSVEAASRSLATSSPRLLRELVKKIIRDKFLSSQLDQCDLTLRDLDEIVEGFMPVLQGIFHTRIEYPNR